MTDIKNSLIAKINNPKEFFSELHSICMSEYQEKTKQLPKVIVEINKEEGVDFCEMAVAAMNDGFGCFNVTPVLDDSLSDMELNMDSVLSLMECLFEGMKNDMAGHVQFKPFEGLITKQPEFLRRLLLELLKQNKPFIVGYISSIYQGLSKGDENNVHKELINLITYKSEYVLMAIADALGALNYKTTKNLKLVKGTLHALEELECKKSNDIDYIIILAYMKLLNYSEKPKKKIVKYSESESLTVKNAVSRVLFLSQGDCGNEDWFSEALLNLSDVDCTYKGIIDNLDYVLSGLIENNNNFQLAETFFISWIINSNYHSKSEELSELFNSTFAAFLNRRDNLEKLLTKLFNHDDMKAHSAASEIVSYCKLRKVPDLKLDKQLLKSLSYVDCLYICRKILGYVISSEYLCSLCFSVFDAFPRNKKIQGLIYEVFRFHIGASYPGKTIEFLKDVSSQTKSKNKKEVASQVVQDIENYYSQVDNLSKLKEMVAPRQRMHKIHIERNKKMAVAMEESQSKSPFMSMVSKVMIKHGTGSFYFMNGKYSEINKMGKFSTTMEIPHTEITHPVDSAMDSMNFRLARRGE
ncbi:MAG: hypothetical protein OQK69_01370 [Gammaproteobacteria bacterium]|nr:hypothetical protein [Gammaproteobacteria bacterium]